ncbi:MAG: replicative helicase loader/inhibitor [Bacillota bacterium]
MDRDEAKKVFRRLAASYPNWKVDKDIAEIWIEELQEADAEHVWANAKEHIKSSKFAPTIAEIVRPNSDVYAEREKERTRQRIMEQQQREKEIGVPPWVKEGIDKKIWIKREIQKAKEKAE